MNTIAFDLGAKTGWGQNWGGVICSGVMLFKREPSEQGDAWRWARASRWFDEVVAGADFAVYEESHFQKGWQAQQAYHALATRLVEACGRHGVPCKGVSVSDLKRWATGKGNCGKLAMIERAVQLSDDFATRYGDWTRERKATAAEVEAAWADEADALLLLAYALETLAEGLQTAGERTETT